jgi:hypothetical protein
LKKQFTTEGAETNSNRAQPDKSEISDHRSEREKVFIEPTGLVDSTAKLMNLKSTEQSTSKTRLAANNSPLMQFLGQTFPH